MNYLDRIIKNFKQASLDRKDNGYPISDHWQEYYKESYLEKFCNPENIKNFRKNQILSKGCDDSDRYASFLDLYENIKSWKISDEFLVNNLSKKNIGNNNTSYKFLGYYLDFAEIVHLKFLSDIKEKLKNKIQVTCEIGGGFGSMARILINNLRTKYILIDLPEANLISSYFLKEHFPDKKFFLYDDYKLNLENGKKKITSQDLQLNDIIILPPWAINHFSSEIKIDFFVNTYSFMEMRYSVLKEYFNFIHSHSNDGAYFLNVNRYIKDTSGEIIKFSKYPYDKYWDCLISQRSSLRYNIHFMLTERKNSNIKKNITDELKKISLFEKGSIKSKEYSKFSNIFIIGLIEIKIKKYLRKILIFIFGVKFLNRLGKKLHNINEKNS